MTKRLKQISALMIAPILLLCMIPASAFAAAGTLNLDLMPQYPYSFPGNFPAPFAGVSRARAGRLSVNGITAYCIEFGKNVAGGSAYNVSDYWDGLSGDKKVYVNYALLFGFTGGTKYGGSGDQAYFATAVLLWQIAEGTVNTEWEEQINNVFFANDPSARSIYYQIKNNVYNYRTIPSFSSSLQGTAPVHELTYNPGTGMCEVTLTDTRGVLPDFDFSSPGCTVTKNGNTLTVSISGTNNLFSFSAERRTHTDAAGYIQYWFPGVGGRQNLVSYARTGTPADPVYAYFNVKISGGTLQIVKTAKNTGGNAGGFQFEVMQGNTHIGTFVSDSGGNISVLNLPAGTYTVREVNLTDEFVEPQNNPQTAEIRAGQTSEIRFDNIKKLGVITVQKTNANPAAGVYSLAGAEFTVTDANGTASDVIVTGGDGTGQSKPLPLGTYPGTDQSHKDGRQDKHAAFRRRV